MNQTMSADDIRNIRLLASAVDMHEAPEWTPQLVQAVELLRKRQGGNNMSQIRGTLNALSEPVASATQFTCNTLIAVWQLQCDDALLPDLRAAVGKMVTLEGEQIATLPYGAVLRVSSVKV